MATEWTNWDAADDIKCEEDAIDFLNAVLELNDPSLVPEALGVIARSHGTAQGVTRARLRKKIDSTWTE